jgi:hypothetical protein
MNCKRVPYPELDCSLKMSKVEGLLQFLKGQTMMGWRGSETEKEAICEALDNLREAQDEYQKVLTLLRKTNKIEL